MDLSSYVESLRRALAVAAQTEGADATSPTGQFAATLESAIRFTLLDALSTAAEEITEDLRPGSVDVRLRAGNPDFVVTPPRSEKPGGDATSTPEEEPLTSAVLSDEGPTARISLRMPESLKTRVDESAGREGLSANAWLVRVVANAVELEERRRRRAGGLRINEGHTGWAQ
ncbi:hypothetical protein SAMN05216188_11732 [Lentzea xinjiangensis]|uniref:HicB family protein n=1 Tax=Lentzea xinjiangensis TaxID=402600 RepID=A0A1H9SX30_9PSEU|nr:hypothetical protein [Lentzea xinjiangensis]SER89448.1 hypothetical protein SAMN05216188_11732 [Lentzea xinjiangensis]